MAWTNDLRDTADEIVGLREDEGRALVLDAGGIFHISWQDGIAFLCTCDVRMDRVKVKIEDDVIFYASCG